MEDSGFVMLGVAVAGFADQLEDPARPGQRRRGRRSAGIRSPKSSTGTKHLLRDRPLWLTVLGISYFWFLGALFQMDLLLFGKEVLQASTTCGRPDGDVPRGRHRRRQHAGRAAARATRWNWDWCRSARSAWASSALALYAARSSYGWSVAALALLGVASGLFIVPLNAYLQQRSERRRKGPADRHQQLLQHAGDCCWPPARSGCCTTGCTSRRTS